ncbi:MAG: tRNA lysidine(34) synthetase TilS [Planctomycetota bacterium]
MTSARPDRAYAQFLPAVDLLPQGARLRVACSGGVDSVALALLLRRLQERRRPDLDLSLGHIHHGLRGVEADQAAKSCQQLAAQLGWQYHERHVDVAAHRAEHSSSEETAARELRRQVYREWGETDQLYAIALAHHRDDQIETVLGNLLRGTALHGLHGILPSTRLDGDSELRLLRPLLDIPKADLRALVDATAVTTCEDSTNASVHFRRNRIRHELLPLLRDYNPRFGRALLALAKEAEQVDNCLQHLTGPLLQECQWGPHAMVVERSVLPQAPDSPLLPVLLRSVWRQLQQRAERGRDQDGLQRDHYEAWSNIATATGSGHHYALPGGWTLERSAHLLSLFLATPGRPTTSYPQPQRTLQTTFGLRARIGPTSSLATGESALCTPLPALDTDNLQWRAVQPADRIETEVGHADVAELLRNAAIPHALRAEYPVLVSDRGVEWIPGVRARSTDALRPWSGQVDCDAHTTEGFLLNVALRRR